MEQQIDRDEIFIRYLLGELSEDERAEVEEEYFVNDDMFEQFLAVKGDLIDAFARGQLEGRKRVLFERHFLSTSPRRRRVDEARSIIEVISKASPAAAYNTSARRSFMPWLKSLLNSLRSRSPLLQFSLAALLFAALLGGVWTAFLRYSPPSNERERNAPEQLAQQQNGQEQEKRQQQQQLADQHQAATHPAANNSPNGNTSDNPSNNTSSGGTIMSASTPHKALERHSSHRTIANPGPSSSSSKAHVASLMLNSMLLREIGQSNTLRLRPDTTRVRLQLILNEAGHRSYRATIRTIEGEEVWSGNSPKSVSSSGGRKIEVTFPSSLLRKRDYILTISGVTAKSGVEELGEYYFAVERKDTPPERLRPPPDKKP